MAGKITTVLTKKEAETYRSQGLHQEAVHLYTDLLASSPHIDPHLKAAVENQIQHIKSELADSDQQPPRTLSAQEIGRIRDGWGQCATEADMLVCAQAFIQIEAHAEALAELHKLLSQGCLKKIYLTAAADCFVQLHPPEAICDPIEKWTQATQQPRKAILAMQLEMTKHMEARQHNRHALALYRHLERIPGLKASMKARADALEARL
ncbi:MAG: hypothetical protein M0036_21855 [Desulfobacteraceae bacterium]|nr:hypothetical protein [Desulfobacteraceae bacterium]